jgi:hypothetical protein
VTKGAGQKIDLQCLLANLRMQVLPVRTFDNGLLGGRGKHVRGLLQHLRLSLRYLIRMHIKLRSQLRQGLVPLYGSDGYLGFKGC